MYTKIKFQNSKANRKALIDLGYKIHDPACTFNRKAWIIISDEGTLLGVNRRSTFRTVTVEEFKKLKIDPL